MRARNRETMQRCIQPERHKLALLTFAGLFAPVYFIPPLIAAVVDGPRFLIIVMALAGTVLLMTYVIMPILTFLAADWLFKKSGKEAQTSSD